mgnify:CR=1 FL=1
MRVEYLLDCPMLPDVERTAYPGMSSQVDTDNYIPPGQIYDTAGWKSLLPPSSGLVIRRPFFRQ